VPPLPRRPGAELLGRLHPALAPALLWIRRRGAGEIRERPLASPRFVSLMWWRPGGGISLGFSGGLDGGGRAFCRL
jgi:hypothetical protein